MGKIRDEINYRWKKLSLIILFFHLILAHLSHVLNSDSTKISFSALFCFWFLFCFGQYILKVQVLSWVIPAQTFLFLDKVWSWFLKCLRITLWTTASSLMPFYQTSWPTSISWLSTLISNSIWNLPQQTFQNHKENRGGERDCISKI